MSFDPSADINVANSPEAMADMRAQAEDDAALDEKYSNPEVLKSQQQEIRNALYKREGTPLTIEQQESNTELFNDMYATDLELILSPEYTDRIRDNFTGSGDIEGSIFQVLQSLDMANEDREELSDLIAEYIDPRITSQRIQENLNSEDGIEVKPGMNASYINAHLGSNRHIDLNEDANSLKVGSALRFNGDETTLLQNDSQIGTLNEENGDLPESARKEFGENRYASLIELHTVHSGENISPLHDISVEQVAEIEAGYMDGMDIVDAMTSILGENHEAVKQAQDLDNPDTIDQRRQDMFEDCDVPLEDRVNPETGSCRDPFTNLISENYIRILGPEGEPDTKASLILASQISANKIIENKHTFTRSKEFDEAYDRISAGEENPEQMQQDLMLIYNTVNNAEGIRGKGRQTETQRTQSARQKALILDGDFQNIQRLLLQTNSETNTTLTENQVDTSAQNTDIQGGEVFSAGKIDIAMTGNEAGGETA